MPGVRLSHSDVFGSLRRVWQTDPVKNRIAAASAVIIAIGLSILGIRIFVAQWQRAQDAERALLALRPFLSDPEVQQLEHDWGFSQSSSRDLVQVSAPGDPGLSRLEAWFAYEVDRRAEEPALAPGARGVVIAWNDGRPELDMLNHLIPIERLAHTPDEIAWIAFCQRSTISMYSAGSAELRSERVDLRIVRREAPGLVGRLTAEGIPPRRVGRADIERVHMPNGQRIANDLVALLDDTRVAVAETPPAFPTECFAESLPPLGDPDDDHYTCVDGATNACLDHCRSGSAGSCLAAAYALDNGWWHRPYELYRLACVGGSSSGCTNYGAAWLANATADDTLATSCSLALFERACAAHDPFGCGMVGRVRASTGGDTAAVRAGLESSCTTVGSFACEELAWMMESGHLGTVDTDEVLRARERGCDTGYAPSCAALPEPRVAPSPSTPAPPSVPDTIVRRPVPTSMGHERLPSSAATR